MSTKRDLIGSALAEIGLGTYIFDATPEQLQESLARLNRMAAEWDGLGIRVGYNLGGDLDADSGVPDTAENCFVTNGAVRIAPTFGKVPSMETRQAATRAFSALYVARGSRPQVPRSPALPLGAGNRVGVLDRHYFPDTTEVPGLNDGATEY